MTKRQQERTIRAINRLETSLMAGTASKESHDRILKEIENAKQNLAGKKVKKTKKQVENKQQEDWVIDIMSVKFGYIKQSERRKNKSKSRKKMRKVKTVTLIRTVKAHDGALQAYREGRMGISPKDHSFRMRKLSEGWN